MKILLVAVLILLSGCAEYRTLISSYGSEGADATLESAEWTLCKAATGGALERRYHLYSDPTNQKAQGWAGLCYGTKQGEVRPTSGDL